jgi:hypothetical protein
VRVVDQPQARPVMSTSPSEYMGPSDFEDNEEYEEYLEE